MRIPTPEDVQGHLLVREALETQVARLFALTASAEEQAELSKLDDMAALPENDGSQYLSRHERLHRKITRRQALADAIEQAHALASTWMCVGSGGHHPRRHQTLLEALAVGNSEAAGAAMRQHVRSPAGRPAARNSNHTWL